VHVIVVGPFSIEIWTGTHLLIPEEGSNNSGMSIGPEVVKIPWIIGDKWVGIG
jgi:hypothetical protein